MMKALNTPTGQLVGAFQFVHTNGFPGRSLRFSISASQHFS